VIEGEGRFRLNAAFLWGATGNSLPVARLACGILWTLQASNGSKREVKTEPRGRYNIAAGGPAVRPPGWAPVGLKRAPVRAGIIVIRTRGWGIEARSRGVIRSVVSGLASVIGVPLVVLDMIP
jgi:hypothetical protein